MSHCPRNVVGQCKKIHLDKSITTVSLSVRIILNKFKFSGTMSHGGQKTKWDILKFYVLKGTKVQPWQKTETPCKNKTIVLI